MRKTLFLIAVATLSSVGVAAQAATCAEMFNKAEKMVMEKASAPVDKKIKAYQMAIESHSMCEKAMAMPAGEKRSMMMKDAEKEFERTYSFAHDIE